MPLVTPPVRRKARVEWGEEHCYEKLSNYFDGSSPTRLTESVKDKRRSDRSVKDVDY